MSTDKPDPAAHDPGTPEYTDASGGWGSLQGVARLFGKDPSPEALKALRRLNKPGGVMCTACAWTKPADPHALEFCENGAKATFWEMTGDEAGLDFFVENSVTALRDRSDYDLEREGRLVHPMRYDPASDRYVPVAWE